MPPPVAFRKIVLLIDLVALCSPVQLHGPSCHCSHKQSSRTIEIFITHDITNCHEHNRILTSITLFGVLELFMDITCAVLVFITVVSAVISAVTQKVPWDTILVLTLELVH